MKYNPKEIVREGLTFTIPLYQRLFEWNSDNVIQLLDDLNRAFEKAKLNYEDNDNLDYFIGMLTSTCSDDNYKNHQLVDGQQRFTVITLIACVIQSYSNENLWHDFLVINGKPRLSFISRRSDAAYLLRLIRKEYNYEGDLVNNKMRDAINTIIEYLKKYDGDVNEFSKFIYNHLSFFITKLPKNYVAQDLNIYFERMNSSGKNLEHHEILKVKILSKLEGNITLYMQLWNKIADVDTVLIRKREYKNENEHDYIQRKIRVLNSKLSTIESEPTLINNLNKEEHNDIKQIKDIKRREKRPNNLDVNFNNGSRSVLRFPQLLLLSLYYFLNNKKGEEFKPRLDDFFNQNNLLDTFKEYLPYEGENVNKEYLKEFFELLLHCRVAMDICFVRSLEHGYSLDMNLPEENGDLKELLMFESFLYVSSSNVTNYKWFGWTMNYIEHCRTVPNAKGLLFELKEKCDSLNKLPKYNKLIFGEEIRYWFWRLDFYIWQHRKEIFSSEEDSSYLDIVENYIFVRNRSIEHIAPQHPRIDSKLQWEENNEEDQKLLNSFGNLAMISQGLNSALSNSSYEEKKAHVESYFQSVNGTIESLKLLMVYKSWPQGWSKNDIPQHGKQMYELLEKEIKPVDEA